MEQREVRTMCGVRLVDRVSSDVLKERVCVVVKMEDILVPSHLRRLENVIPRQKRRLKEIED